MMGTSGELRPFRQVVARAFLHETMTGVCRTFAGTTLPANISSRLPTSWAVSAELKGIAQVFRDAQEKRHLADYDLARPFPRYEVLALIANIEEAMSLFARVRTDPGTKFFLVCLLGWGVLERRK